MAPVKGASMSVSTELPSVAPEAAPAARPRVFVAFAGGGAKGLSHVGALEALEEHKVEYQGCAGTSAGAIIAALAAARVKADDMVDPHSDASIVLEINSHLPHIKVLTDLFGPADGGKSGAFGTFLKSSIGGLFPRRLFGRSRPSRSSCPSGSPRSPAR
jgi:hypothetical protein